MDLTEEIKKQKFMETNQWKLNDISQDEFCLFIIDNFLKFFNSDTNEVIIKKIVTISSSFYYYQFGVENKLTRKTQQDFHNQWINRQTKAINNAKKLKARLDDATIEAILDKIISNPQSYVKLPENIPEGQITRKSLIETSQLCISKRLLTNKQKERKGHNYSELNKIISKFDTLIEQKMKETIEKQF